MKLLAFIDNLYKDRLEMFEEMCVNAKMHLFNSDAVLFVGRYGKEITFSSQEIIQNKNNLCFYQTMFSNLVSQYFPLDDYLLTESVEFYHELEELRVQRIVMTMSLLSEYIEKQPDFICKRMFILTAFFVYLYFFMTENPALITEPNIKGLFEEVASELNFMFITEDKATADETYSEALDLGLIVINNLEQNKLYKRPFYFMDLFTPIRCKIRYKG